MEDKELFVDSNGKLTLLGAILVDVTATAICNALFDSLIKDNGKRKRKQKRV